MVHKLMLVFKVIKWYNSKRFIIPHTRNHRHIYKGLYILMTLLRICNVIYSLCCNHKELVHGTFQKLRAMSSTELRSHCHCFSIPKDKDQETLGLRPVTENSSNLLGTVLFLSAAWGPVFSCKEIFFTFVSRWYCTGAIV